MGALPLDELDRPPGEGPAHVVDPTVQTHERDHRIAEVFDHHVGHAVAVEVDGPAGGAVEQSEEHAGHVRGEIVRVVLEDHDLALTDDDGHRTRDIGGDLECG
jgi:hypothetical protein